MPDFFCPDEWPPGLVVIEIGHGARGRRDLPKLLGLPITRRTLTMNVSVGSVIVMAALYCLVFNPELVVQEKYSEDCLVKALRNFRCRVERESGPHWILRDGNRRLQTFGKKSVVVPDRSKLASSKKYRTISLQSGRASRILS